MNYLIRNATICDKDGAWNQKKCDLLISRGKIEKIAKKIDDEQARVIEGKHLVVSPGWLDIGTNLTEPGFEDLDDIKSLCASAEAGGFTELAVLPNTNPILDHKGAIETIKFRSVNELVTLFPIGALTRDTKGTDISEMTDMINGGAIAFSDGKHSIQHAGVLKRALRYIVNLDAIIINHPNDNTLSENGIMNESGESAYLGLKGIPALSEEVMLNRDIKLCEYTESSLLAHMITTKESVKLVKKAKQDRVGVCASVSYHNLVETDASLKSFDPMHKVMPPLRTKNDVNALVRGLLDDTIDCIVSNHIPVDVEDKKKAFLYAEYGSLGLEQLFGVLWTRFDEKIPIETLMYKLSNGPRKVLGLPEVHLDEGTEANLTIVDTEEEWTFEESDIKSKSRNAAFLDQTLKGKVIGVFANKKNSL